MAIGRMHDDEVGVDEPLVRALLAAQFPELAGLPLTHVAHGGTDHHLWRIGDELQMRLPKHAPSTGQAEKDEAILPRLAPHLPVAVPELVGHGAPGEGYPFAWAVYRWLPGEPPTAATPQLAEDVAGFIRALQRIDPTGGPPARRRGAPLARSDDAFFRSSLAQLTDEYDVPRLTALWERACAAPDWSGEPVWLHADILPSNLLVRDGRLAAVIDWGVACVGDPACDLMIAWSLLAPVRDTFRAAVGADDPTWERARGWAVWQATCALPYYRETNPPMVALARTVLGEVLAEA
jgi:aminoglycoside phosphotransferase (APT) family kinase protein